MSSAVLQAAAHRPAQAGAGGDVIPFPHAAVAPAASGHAPEAMAPRVLIRPADASRRQSAAWRGISGDVVAIMRHEPFEMSFRASCHLLIAQERGCRSDGETVVEGLAPSRLHDFSRKLTFVPAGARFHEWQHPRGLTRATCLYIDPAAPLLGPESRFGEVALAPRLFFDNQALWETALKLKALIEAGAAASGLYAEALGAVLAHELLRLHRGASLLNRPARGGLADWQQKTITRHLEENLADQIPLARLAALVQLSPFHFSRAFKQSFGTPPHRYHTMRRIERAKALLAQPERSVTDIALELGFSDTSAFTAAFRRLTGWTPTAYRRSLL
jgi:AraC family transcriptional regulator